MATPSRPRERSRFRAEYLLLLLLLVTALFPDELGRFALSVLPSPPATPPVSQRFELTARESVQPLPAAPAPLPQAAEPPGLHLTPGADELGRALPVPTSGASAGRVLDAGGSRSDEKASSPIAQTTAAPAEHATAGSAPVVAVAPVAQELTPPARRSPEGTLARTSDISLNAAPATMPAGGRMPSFGGADVPIRSADPVPLLPAPVNFVGVWVGSYEGADTGSFQVVVGDDGTVRGQGQSRGLKVMFPITGVVVADGRVSLDGAAVGVLPGSHLSGNLQAATGSGRWTFGPPLNFSGSWRVRRSLTSRD